LLNLVNILRKGNNNGRFDEAEYFLLTGNYTTIQIANNQKVKQNGQIPLATTLNFLIDRFWFTLNKGFGQSSRLKSFDVTTKAQIVLASIINKSVTKAFDALKVELSSGRLTKEQSEYILADLRQRSKKPEDIIPDDLNELLDSLDNASIEIALQEKEIIRNKAKKNEAENIFLKDEYKKKDEQLRALNIELQRYKEEEKQKNYKSLKRKILFRKCLFIFLLILFIGIAICLCVYVFTNTERLNKLGSAIGIFAALITVVGFLYYTICQIYKLFKKVNP
jgi:hypothetical protein